MDKSASKLSLPKIEHSILDFWRSHAIFDQVIKARSSGPPFVFYDGPPFANGTPHYGHITQMAVKDAVLRYKTMRGFNVPRKIGWDTHGLPIEYELEKELELSGKKAIENYGVEKFIEAARTSVLRYSDLWLATMERMGRWMDLNNPYTTMDSAYIESVWWAFKTLHDKGYIYEDYRVGPYCVRCGTVLSNFEVNLGYKDNVADPSIYVAFPLIKPHIRNAKLADAKLLVWTTTPWTLPSNWAIAVNPNAHYDLVEDGGQRYLVAQRRRLEVFGDIPAITTVYGHDLVNLEYVPLYERTNEANSYRVIDGGDSVVLTEGTGLLHVAPAYGENDFLLRKKYHPNSTLLQNITPDGQMDNGFPGSGLFFKAADKAIIQDLSGRYLLYKCQQVNHTYPYCWRCDTPLVYYPTTSWYVAVTKIKNELIDLNKTIKWQPEHIGTGRFGKWLEGARDWAISRDRFWGAPIPVWKCTNTNHKDAVPVIISSFKDLHQYSLGNTPKDLHRPHIDNVIFMCQCGGEMHRELFVFDCWFESGSMPFAQFGYPHKNQEMFNPENEINYPADFIVEALDQTRGWFYTLHVLGVALFGKTAFKAVDVNGLILADDGKKLSKKLRNYTEPEALFETEGVDAFRLFVMTATTMGEDYRFSTDAIRDVRRRWITPLLNVVNYFALSKEVVDNSETSEFYTKLDDWMKARVAQARKEVFAVMDGDTRHVPYDLVRACRTFGPLVEDLSTWYVRLCRGRTDSSFTDTLQQVLIKISTTYAAFLPFVTEHIYQKVSVKDCGFPESIHLCLLKSLDKWENPELLTHMDVVRNIVTLGREQRAIYKINNRQPLSEARVNCVMDDWMVDLVIAELNVKQVQHSSRNGNDSLRVELDTTLTEDLISEGNANELRRTIQDLRRQAGLAAGQPAQVTISNLSEKVKQALSLQLKTTRISDTTPSTVLMETIINDWHIVLGR